MEELQMEQKSTPHQKQQKMYALIQEYLASGMSQRKFCEDQSIPYSTFCWWLRKYRSHQSGTKPKEKAAQKFIPIHLSSPTDSLLGSQSSCVIEYPNGVTVRLAGRLDTGVLTGLIGLRLS